MTVPSAVVPAEAVLVFDVDDTLYLERSYVRSGFEAVGRLVAAEHGIAGFGATLWAGFEAGVRGDAFNRALAAHAIDPAPELVATLVDCYRSHRPDIEPLPDAARLLDQLDGRPVAAITDGPPSSQRAKIDALGVGDRLGFVVVTGEHGEGFAKPSQAPFRLVTDTLGVDPEQCWYLGDNPRKDLVPAAWGWSVVRIRRPGSLHEAVPTPDGVTEIASLDELTLGK